MNYIIRNLSKRMSDETMHSTYKSPIKNSNSKSNNQLNEKWKVSERPSAFLAARKQAVRTVKNKSHRTNDASGNQSFNA